MWKHISPNSLIITSLLILELCNIFIGFSNILTVFQLSKSLKSKQMSFASHPADFFPILTLKESRKNKVTIP